MIAINDLDTPTAEREGKHFATLAARFALAGMGLIKADAEAGAQAPYFAVDQYGQARGLHSLEDAAQWLHGGCTR